MPLVGRLTTGLSPFADHVARWSGCRRCDLCETRGKVVLARGKLPCDVLFIGEAPGESENVLGRPFVGPAGSLLDWMIGQSFEGLTVRWAMTNIVGCIPRDEAGVKTHEPSPEAVAACRPRLVELVRIAKPRLLVTVGLTAKKNVPTPDDFAPVDWLPKPQEFLEYLDIIHPAAILRGNISQQPLAIQKTIVALADAVDFLTEA